MFDGIFNPAFLQAACAHAAPEPPVEENTIIIRLNSSGSFTLSDVSCSGQITIKSISGGAETIKTGQDLEEENISSSADANTDIIITGDVEILSLSPMGFQNKVIVFDASKCNSLQRATIGGTQTSLKTLGLPSSCTYFLGPTSASAISSITYPASNSSIASTLSGYINNSSVNNGTLYTDSEGEYYSTIADAATAKGWTIEQLPA